MLPKISPASIPRTMPMAFILASCQCDVDRLVNHYGNESDATNASHHEQGRGTIRRWYRRPWRFGGSTRFAGRSSVETLSCIGRALQPRLVLHGRCLKLRRAEDEDRRGADAHPCR